MTTRLTTRTPLMGEDPFPGESDETAFHAYPHSVDRAAITKCTAIVGAIARVEARIDAVLTPLIGYRSRLEQIENWEPCWVWPTEDAVAISQTPRLADEALAAIADIRRWLRASQAEAADVVGIAERTIPNWKSGRSPHPSSVRKLFATHGFLRSLTLHLGRDEMLLWLDSESQQGMTRRSLLREIDGLTQTVREARPILFPAPLSVGLLASEPEVASTDELLAEPPEYPESSGRDIRPATRVP